ncbi:hypothetical protein, partial [Cysteiniphilum marinum]|uniref:hypothetical protein n=1 Tax=Cysteiniphilum marinum TaxID=2774191 RepID=UPI00193A241B
MSQQDNDIISMSDLLVTLIKHIKLWLVIVVLGVILSVIYGVKSDTCVPGRGDQKTTLFDVKSSEFQTNI